MSNGGLFFGLLFVSFNEFVTIIVSFKLDFLSSSKSSSESTSYV